MVINQSIEFVLQWFQNKLYTLVYLPFLTPSMSFIESIRLKNGNLRLFWQNMRNFVQMHSPYPYITVLYLSISNSFTKMNTSLLRICGLKFEKRMQFNYSLNTNCIIFLPFFLHFFCRISTIIIPPNHTFCQRIALTQCYNSHLRL